MTAFIVILLCDAILIGALLGIRYVIKHNYKSTFERCASCASITDTPTNQHISIRRYYIEGAGQLCQHCYNILYTHSLDMKIPEFAHTSKWYD